MRQICVRPAIRTGNFGRRGRTARVDFAPSERSGLSRDALAGDLRWHAGPESTKARAKPVRDDCGVGIAATLHWKFAGMHDPAAMPRSRGQSVACLTGVAAPRPKPKGAGRLVLPSLSGTTRHVIGWCGLCAAFVPPVRPCSGRVPGAFVPLTPGRWHRGAGLCRCTAFGADPQS